MLTRVDGQTSRRAFLGLAAAGCADPESPGGAAAPRAPSHGHPVAQAARGWRNPLPENALPGTSDWVIRHVGAEHEIEGYAGKASVLPGEPLPLFVSTTARAFTATAYRLGRGPGDGAPPGRGGRAP